MMLSEPHPVLPKVVDQWAFRDQPDLAARMVAAINAGAEYPREAVYALGRNIQSDPAYTGMGMWSKMDVFQKDKGFTQTRFDLYLDMGEATIPPKHILEMRTLALGQAMRMCEKGSFNPSRLNRLNGHLNRPNCEERPDLVVPLFAHDGDTYKYFVSYQDQYLGEDSDADDWVTPLLRQADALRNQLFRNRWLPAQISAAEYAETVDIADVVLAELYAQQWQAGYAGYHAARNGGAV